MPLDFPSSPTNGQVYGNYYYNSARGAWNALLPAATPNFFTNATLNTSTLVDATATSSLISTTPLTVIGLSGQTANLQEWKNSSGTVVAAITPSGAITGYGSNLMQSFVTTRVPLTVKGSSGQTANLQEWQNSSGTVISRIDSAGRFNSDIAVNVGGFTPGVTFLGVQTTAATPGAIIKGAATQTADLQQWQSSTGAVLSEINSAGELQVPRIGINGQPPNASFFIDATGRAKFRSDGSSSSGVWFTDSAGTESAFLGMGGTTASDSLGIWHNSAWRLQVDTLGRVMMPFQPAFYAYGSGTVAITSPQQDYIMPMTTAELNRGNYYNTSNYRFTAPVAGVYYFWMQAVTTDSSSSTGPEIFIYKNGSALNNVSILYNSAFYNTFGASYIMSLNANDYIQMSVRNNNATTFTIERGRSRFAGYLIG